MLHSWKVSGSLHQPIPNPWTLRRKREKKKKEKKTTETRPATTDHSYLLFLLLGGDLLQVRFFADADGRSRMPWKGFLGKQSLQGLVYTIKLVRAMFMLSQE